MDDVEKQIRAAAPFPSLRNSGLTARAKADLADLLKEPRARHTKFPRRALIAGVALAVLTTTGVSLAILVPPPPPAVASPPLLEPTIAAGDRDEVLDELRSGAASLPDVSSSRVIASETWSADIEQSEDGVPISFVQPREIVRIREADGSGEIRVSAGAVRWGRPSGSEAEGEVLELQSFEAGEYPMLFPSAPPEGAQALRALLDGALGADPSSGDYLRVIVDLREEWMLTRGQTTAVLDFITGLPDIVVLGEVQDRLGRDGIALSTTTRGDGIFQDILVFDAGTGALIAGETVYLGGLAEIDLPSPSVMHYVAWSNDSWGL